MTPRLPPGQLATPVGPPVTERDLATVEQLLAVEKMPGPQGDPGVGTPGATGPAGPPGSSGSPGTNGTDGRTILSGTGAPGGGTGADGDFYLDTATSTLYGPKAAGVWPAGVSLVGATGPAGATGATGATGPAGPTGATGATGAAGATGIDGRSILNGTGVPGGGLGANGDFYIDTNAPKTIYGPKTAGAWGAGTSLVGSPGAPGADATAIYGDPVTVVHGGTGATTAPAARTNFGLVIGTDVQAQNANLAALAGLTGAANKAAVFTGAGTMALRDVRGVLDGCDAGPTVALTTALQTMLPAVLTLPGPLLVVGDKVVGEAAGTFLQNSGAGRQITTAFVFGASTNSNNQTNVLAASATAGTWEYRIVGRVNGAGDIKWRQVLTINTGLTAAVIYFKTFATTDAFTSPVTIDLKVLSSAATATQTWNLTHATLERVAA